MTLARRDAVHWVALGLIFAFAALAPSLWAVVGIGLVLVVAAPLSLWLWRRERSRARSR